MPPAPFHVVAASIKALFATAPASFITSQAGFSFLSRPPAAPPPPLQPPHLLSYSLAEPLGRHFVGNTCVWWRVRDNLRCRRRRLEQDEKALGISLLPLVVAVQAEKQQHIRHEAKAFSKELLLYGKKTRSFSTL